jgi:hypothetical protein
LRTGIFAKGPLLNKSTTKEQPYTDYSMMVSTFHKAMSDVFLPNNIHNTYKRLGAESLGVFFFSHYQESKPLHINFTVIEMQT